MIIGNDSFNQNNNFQNKMNTIKENAKNNIHNGYNSMSTNKYKDVNNRSEMVSGSLEILQERFNQGLISYDDFIKQCNKLRK